MKLYTNPQSRAVRVEIMLDELGVDLDREVIDLKAKQNLSQDYLKVHPLGQVPALIDGRSRTNSLGIRSNLHGLG